MRPVQHGPLRGLPSAIPRHHDHPVVAQFRMEWLRHEIQAVGIGQPYVEQDDCRMLSPDGGDGLLA